MGFFTFQKSFVIRKNLKNNHIRRESADWKEGDRKKRTLDGMRCAASGEKC